MHASNVYEDGNMPFMQRITWTGIALHAGVLPGHPASHGCVRLPIAFAQQLFGVTDIGLRVIVVRDDILPAAIEHPNLFKQNPARLELALATPPANRTSGERPRASHPARVSPSASNIPPAVADANRSRGRRSTTRASCSSARSSRRTEAPPASRRC